MFMSQFLLSRSKWAFLPASSIYRIFLPNMCKPVLFSFIFRIIKSFVAVDQRVTYVFFEEKNDSDHNCWE